MFLHIWVCEWEKSQTTYMASSNFFSAIALLPRALSSSADDMSVGFIGRYKRLEGSMLRWYVM